MPRCRPGLEAAPLPSPTDHDLIYMGDGFQYFDILLLAVIAAVIVLRLRSVLGRRGGHEPSRPAYDPFKKEGKEEQSEDKVV